MPWLEPDEHQRKVEAARDIVLRRLDRSAAPRAALAELLARKEVEADIAQEVLDRLENAGLIDDRAYAAMVARTRFTEKGAGRRAIADELRRKGLPAGAIQEALDQINDEDERSAAKALALKKLRTLASQPYEVQRRRTLAMLARKGYGGATANAAFSWAHGQLQDGDDEQPIEPVGWSDDPELDWSITADL